MCSVFVYEVSRIQQLVTWTLVLDRCFSACKSAREQLSLWKCDAEKATYWFHSAFSSRPNFLLCRFASVSFSTRQHLLDSTVAVSVQSACSGGARDVQLRLVSTRLFLLPAHKIVDGVGRTRVKLLKSVFGHNCCVNSSL